MSKRMQRGVRRASATRSPARPPARASTTSSTRRAPTTARADKSFLRRDDLARRRRPDHDRLPGQVRHPRRAAAPGRPARSSSSATPPTGSQPEDVAKRPGWATMTAVKDGAVRPIDDDDDHAPRTAPRPAASELLGRRDPPGRRPSRRPSPIAARCRDLARGHASATPRARLARPVARSRPPAAARVVGLVVLAVGAVLRDRARHRGGPARRHPRDRRGPAARARTSRAPDADAGGDRLGPARAAGPDRDGRGRRAWRSPGRPSRACCGTRSRTRTCWARRRARRWARRSPCCIPVRTPRSSGSGSSRRSPSSARSRRDHRRSTSCRG